MKFYILFFLLVFSFSLNAQQFDNVDNFVKSVKFDNDESIDNLVRKITKPFDSEIDKTRAIYYWIASNIEYDYERYKTDFWQQYSSEDEMLQATFKFRKGICAGYSKLFKYMLNLCNVESEVIIGYARNREIIFLNETNHAWNSVKINNIWYLFDVTWARDTLNNVVDNFYFQTDPEIFILNHYPTEKKWTLLKENISLESFMNFPIYTNLYYDLDFTNDSPMQGQLNAFQDTVTVILKPNFDCVFLTKLYDFDNEEWITNQIGEFKRLDNGFKLFIPRKGKFLLRVGAIRQAEYSSTFYDELVYYIIENK